MTERVFGTPGKKRRRRLALFAPLALLAVASVMLIAASAAPAINTTEADYSLLEDQDGRNDEPGQKDLTLQGTDTGDLPTAINVLWNWDETSVGGGNSLDGCALFSTDFPDENIDFAFCAIVGNVSNTDKTLELKSTVLYTCGDNRNDRCTQPITIVPLADRDPGTTCQLVLNSNTNPFADDFPGDNPDTRIYCTVVLDDVGGATSATLINTCSYPSQQPNSDPSDCVAVPGKANPTIATTPTLIPQDTATLTGQSGTGGSVTFNLYKDDGDLDFCEATELVFSQTDSSSPFATSNDGTPDANTLNGYTITSDGIYKWKVNYSGDADNNPAESACGVEQYNDIDVTPNPS
jgi:hypothetical protein